MASQVLSIRGAAEHNLQHLDLDLPHGHLIAFSGVSGSGKTSLVFDTLYAEARRRFLVALDRTGQGAIRRVRSPRVRQLEGLAPAVAIDQGGFRQNPRSTVATLSGIYEYLRLLYARLGQPHCLVCGAEVRSQRFEEVWEIAAGLPAGTRLMVLAPRRLGPEEDEAAFLQGVDRAGYRRIRAGAEVLLVEEIEPRALRGKPLAVVIDRLVIRPDAGPRLKGSLQAAVQVGEGRVALVDLDSGTEQHFSVRPLCSACGASFRPLEPALFSFNSSQGACPECWGLGRQRSASFAQVFDGGRATVEEALGPLWRDFGHLDWRRQLEQFCARHGLDVDLPVGEWDQELANWLWQGERGGGRFAGVQRWLEELRERASAAELSWLDAFLADEVCASCKGTRLRPEALAVEVGGENIAQFASRSLDAAVSFLDGLDFRGPFALIGATLVEQIGRILRLLQHLGLGYLSLDRRVDSLSRGEFQRLRLAAALGSQMTQVLYVLDEPSVGLHARDLDRLWQSLEALRDAGNTVLVVEHDPAVLRRADLLVDLGPGAGSQGGRVVAFGTPAQVAASTSLTGQYLRGALRLGPGRGRPLGSEGWLCLEGARGHNLKEITASFPLGNLICVTGVSGSGKSTLVHQTLYPLLAAHLHGVDAHPLPYARCQGIDRLERVVAVDQRPIGRTPRSNAATYTGLLAAIRRLFAELPEARLRAYRPSHFSFNAVEGACPECRGSGFSEIRQGIFGALEVPCRTCGGRRFKSEILEIRFRGRNIAEVLELSASEALSLFEAIPEVARRLRLLEEVGLGYLRLGQPSPSFSGGEAQRIKLAAELGRPQRRHTLYILDEPTTGLHLEDIRFLLELLQRLVDEGNTAIVVEHNLELIAAADYLIDLGPEGGEAGGRIVAAGTPRQVAAVAESWTGRFLRQYFAAEEGRQKS